MNVWYKMKTKGSETVAGSYAKQIAFDSSRGISEEYGVGGKADPADSRRNDPREKGLAKLTADGKGALSPRAKLVAEREQSGELKKQPALKGLAELTAVDETTRSRIRRTAPKLL